MLMSSGVKCKVLYMFYYWGVIKQTKAQLLTVYACISIETLETHLFLVFVTNFNIT